MKTSLLIISAAILFTSIAFADTKFNVKNGKLSVTNGKIVVGGAYSVSTSTSTTGQCMGILCGVTYPF